MTRHAFIIGGTGQIGRSTAENLLRHGWKVTVSHRGHRPPPTELMEQGLKIVTLDRDESGSLQAALGSGVDALIDTVAYDETHARQLLNIQSSVGALLVISSASVYRDDAGRTLDEARQNGFPEFTQPIKESQATVHPGPETYSTRKVALERALLDRAACPVTVLRPCAIHGPSSQHPREWWFVKRMRDGREMIPLAFEGRSRFHTTSVRNITELTRVSLEVPGTRVLNIGDPDPPSVAEIGRFIARALDYRGRIVGIRNSPYPPPVGASPWSGPRSFLIDGQAALAIGYEPTVAYAEAVVESCRWLSEVADRAPWPELFPVLASYPRDLFDYAAEDAFLEKHPDRWAALDPSP
ncbi:NAD-dependent epimerase/dehydratase family protein [Microvirga aerilata]|uniref:NAD-dependent epimerase/dehydratase family protein n=1 Tax=Microvirga aerilata TaxID=670292 RepID=A0A936Z9P3_9HYPH|nr:NAD-dependent epimerase/dehydratase family protein [Microvirga aerilata]MBL0403555.1 NAD-dependent epimerase/dehydratase family protein [Microvirga aerilata]